MQKIHLKAPDCWIDDPNGFIYYRGKYHLFYQCFPYAPSWGRMLWGHVVSSDLVHWKHLKTALFPSKHDDRDGFFRKHSGRWREALFILYWGKIYKGRS